MCGVIYGIEVRSVIYGAIGATNIKWGERLLVLIVPTKIQVGCSLSPLQMLRGSWQDIEVEVTVRVLPAVDTSDKKSIDKINKKARRLKSGKGGFL